MRKFCEFHLSKAFLYYNVLSLLIGICLVMLSTPVGSMTAMLAQQYGGDYELDFRSVALTTLLSVVTMPLVSMLVG